MQEGRISLAEIDKACDPALKISAGNMKGEMARFSRTFDYVHYANALKIRSELPGATLPKVTSWELYDRAFTWPRVRRYDTVELAMDTLEHFQANLNANLDNSKQVEAFIAHAKEVQRELNAAHPHGAFRDPAKYYGDDEENMVG